MRVHLSTVVFVCACVFICICLQYYLCVCVCMHVAQDVGISRIFFSLKKICTLYRVKTFVLKEQGDYEEVCLSICLCQCVVNVCSMVN